MNIRVDRFGGIQPRLHPSLLADGMAVRARNVKLKSGKLVPLRQPAQMSGHAIYMENGLTKIGLAKTLYPWKHTDKDGDVLVDFLAFPGVVSIAQGNLAADEYDRLFVTGETGVPFTDADGKTWDNSPAVYLFDRQSNVISRMTINKNPLGAPEVSLKSGETIDTDKTLYYVNFFASWVDGYGLESGLSPASDAEGSAAYGGVSPKPLTLNDGSTVQFGAMTLPANAEKVYIYATSAGTSEATDGIQFFREVSKTTATTVGGFQLKYYPATLGEAEPGIESPPGDLSGIVYVDGGFYAAFSPSSPHTVMFSDIGIVTSWPIAYRYDVKDNIVALATTSNSVFALTDGFPWVLSGTAPETMTAARLAGPAACVSPRSVIVYKNSAYYASNEGYMVIANSADAGTVCANLTEKIFTKDQWQSFGPSTCIAGQHDGCIHLFFDGMNGLRIDLSESVAAVTTHDEKASCMCVDDREDRMYFVRRIRTEGGE